MCKDDLYSFCKMLVLFNIVNLNIFVFMTCLKSCCIYDTYGYMGSMYTYMYVCVYVCMYVCMYACVCMYIRMHVCVYVCMYV